jgi:hypothetical protein
LGHLEKQVPTAHHVAPQTPALCRLVAFDTNIWQHGLAMHDQECSFAPQALENVFKGSPFIEQIMIVGADRKFVSALIVPSFTHLKSWMQLHSIPFTTNEDALKNSDVIKK